MAHITALLIVLTLTGQPVAYALCNAWCDQQSDMPACDEAIAPPTSTSISVTSSTCRVLLTTGPFLHEEGRSALQKATAAHVAPTVTPARSDLKGLASRAGDRDATSGRPLPILVLRV